MDPWPDPTERSPALFAGPPQWVLIARIQVLEERLVYVVVSFFSRARVPETRLDSLRGVEARRTTWPVAVGWPAGANRAGVSSSHSTPQSALNRH